MNDFYNRIDSLIKSQKKSKEELTKVLGLSSVQVFYNWKNLKKVPDINTAYRIAQFLDTTVEFLLTGENKQDKSEMILSDLQKIINNYS